LHTVGGTSVVIATTWLWWELRQMADYSVYQSVTYSGGAKSAGESYNPTATLTNTFDGDEIVVPDELLLDQGGGNEIVGLYVGTTTISGSVFIVVDAGEIGGVQTYYLFGPSTPSPFEIPDSFDDLVVDTDPFIVCFLAGTRIATPAGETPVEALAIGDLVVTTDGRTAPVKWVGMQTVATLFADRLRTFPIRITAGALGENLPVRDLLVSPDHALMLDGVLVQASALVNGTTILRETAMPNRFTYFHIELADHALILAEGVAAETFLDTVTRRRFDNFAEYVALYGEADARLTELPAPRVKSARQLPAALRERLAAQAGIGRSAA
jgi:hypothetical protein